jgi:hypothetical protein
MQGGFAAGEGVAHCGIHSGNNGIPQIEVASSEIKATPTGFFVSQNNHENAVSAQKRQKESPKSEHNSLTESPSHSGNIVDGDGERQPWFGQMMVVSQAVYAVGLTRNGVHLCKNYRPLSGYVYFLLKNKEVVYVGQTFNLPARICQHKKRFGDQFNNSFYIIIKRSQLRATERVFIHYFMPKLNVASKSRPFSWLNEFQIFAPTQEALEHYRKRVRGESKIEDLPGVSLYGLPSTPTPCSGGVK